MTPLKFKEFSWPNNPHIYRETISREPLYVTEDGVTSFEGISENRRIIAGSGIFFGAEAYQNFKTLIMLAEDDSPGYLIHPLWGSRYCYLMKLELNQEPREDYVAYSFEFVQAQDDGTIPK